jgi:Flp pilus assembly CpaE family ATPase
VFILAALETPDVATTQAVTKAGAWDYLVHPFDEEQIAACLRLWGEVPSASPGRLVCFLPARGGDGASTVALHVAESAVHERSARGFAGRVLLVDLDFQAGDMAFRLRLAPQRTLGDALLTPDSAPSRWKDCVCPWGQVDVLASPPPGAILANDPLSRTDPQGGAVADTRLAALLSSAKARYPLVVCDLPPAMHSSARAVLRLADEVCVVCTPEITSVHFARRRVEELQQAGVGVENVRLILNRTGSHAWIGVEEVAQVVGAPVSALLANDYGGLQTAILAGGVVARRSTLGRQIGELTRQTLGVRARVAAA